MFFRRKNAIQKERKDLEFELEKLKDQLDAERVKFLDLEKKLEKKFEDIKVGKYDDHIVDYTALLRKKIKEFSLE